MAQEIFNSYREASKKVVGRNIEEGYRPNNDEVMLGAVLRIADASEAMAQNHVQLQKDRDFYKRRYEETLQRNSELTQQLITQRGMTTRYKNKANTFQRVLQRIMNISGDTGRAGCTWGDTEFDSLSAVAGYNQALSNVKSEIVKHTKIR